MTDLKACPFCGGESSLSSSHWATSGKVAGYFVECIKCCATGPEKSTESLAAKAWNEAGHEV